MSRAIARIAVLGGESTGKTTLARALAAALGEPWVAEYGRELWEERNGELDFEDLLRIGEEQVRREEAATLSASACVICDTTPLTTLFYSLEMFGRADPALEALAARRYDLTLLCADDFEFVQDGWRRTTDFRAHGQDWYRRILAEQGVSWIDVEGSLEERLRRLQPSIAKLRA